MKQQIMHSWKRVVAQGVLIIVPTLLIVGYLLNYANSYLSILQNNWLSQTFYFAAGIILSTLVYSYRLRFISTFLVIIFLLYSVYLSVGKINVGEFDAFYFSVKFMIFSYLFIAGWITGFGFIRTRFYPVIWSVALLTLQIVITAKAPVISAKEIIIIFTPVLLYALYIIYTGELLRNTDERIKPYYLFIAKRLGAFLFLAVVILSLLLLLFQKDFKGIEKEWAGKEGGDKGGQESMTKDNKDGTIKNNDQMKMTGSLSKDKRLVFVAHVDNFFPDGKTPNPLYFTNLYYTKFDVSTQTFEIDTTIPKNDLFSPDPSKIPLYFTKTDSTVLKNSMAPLQRKIVTADVYKTLLSANEFVAPSTAFYCQPIAVENEYKNQFKSAYKAKMSVSTLNSAYFIYNPAGNKQLADFQEQRFDVLRKAASYDKVDKVFMQYYTYMPDNEEYKRITALAAEITKNATTPVDKMIAIRNYFTGKDELDQPLFRYSDNPGIPGLPSASKLNYFLFENRKGYCAYYAGATLFMLRSLGLPSRIAAGFLTVDRSSKNPGWYWFYADQAHAWVQLFFPGYGWIDFDTTVPDQNTQESPQPDGTPPMNTQQPVMVTDGQVIQVDTIHKLVTIKINKMLFEDVNINHSSSDTMVMDATFANITKDTGLSKLSDIKPGNNIVAVSYDEALKNTFINETDDVATLVKKLPKPVPVDEIKIMETEDERRIKKASADKDKTTISWVKIVYSFFAFILLAVILLLVMPFAIWAFLNNRAKNAKDIRTKSFYIYRACLFYLHQIGVKAINESPEQFARKVDQVHATNFHHFLVIYQKMKYSKIHLTESEMNFISQFFSSFKQQIKLKYSLQLRIKAFLLFNRTFHYFTSI